MFYSGSQKVELVLAPNSRNEGGHEGFEIVDFRNFDGPVTLTLTLDDLEYYIVQFVSSTSIHSTIEQKRDDLMIKSMTILAIPVSSVQFKQALIRNSKYSHRLNHFISTSLESTQRS